MSVTVNLSKPIKVGGEEQKELTLRRPTPEDARALKLLPYVAREDGSVTMDAELASRYISRLAAIPPSSVDQLDIADLNTLCWTVFGFFTNTASAT